MPSAEFAQRVVMVNVISGQEVYWDTFILFLHENLHCCSCKNPITRLNFIGTHNLFLCREITKHKDNFSIKKPVLSRGSGIADYLFFCSINDQSLSVIYYQYFLHSLYGEWLTFKMPCKIAADDILTFYFYFSEKIRYDILCELFTLLMIYI